MGTTAISDKELVHQILGGKREAFATLVERHLQPALAIARARLLNPIDADDAVQEAFLRAFAQLRTLREPGKFGPWLLTIVRHEAVRLVARGKSTVGADPAAVDDIAAEPNPSQREIHALLRQRIETLPEVAREVLLLHYFAGRSAGEIATLLGIRRSAVRKRLQRARETLAENLLHEIESERPSSHAAAKQIARIATLASGLTLPTAASATAMVASTTLLSLKLPAIAMGIAGAAVIVGLTVQTVRQKNNEAPTIKGNAAVVASTDAATPNDSTEPTPSPTASTTTAQAQRPLTVESPQQAENTDSATWPRRKVRNYESAHLADVLSKLEESSGKHYLIDRRAVGVPIPSETKLDIQTHPYASDGWLDTVRIPANTPILEAIDQVANPVGLKAVLAPGYIFISTPAQIRADALHYTHAEYQNYTGWDVRTPKSFNFENVHITEVMEFLNEIMDKNIIIDQRAIESTHPNYTQAKVFAAGKFTDGIVLYVNVKDIHLEDALRAIARMMNLKVVMCDDYFWLSSPNLIRRDGLNTKQRGPERMQEFAASPITIAFEDVHVKEIFEFINEIYQVAVVLDPRTAVWPDEPYTGAPLAKLRNAPALISPGLLHEPRLSGISPQSTLEIATRSLDLVYEIRDDRVVISNAESITSAWKRPDDLIPAKDFGVQAQPFMRAFSRTGGDQDQSANTRRWIRNSDMDSH